MGRWPGVAVDAFFDGWGSGFEHPGGWPGLGPGLPDIAVWQRRNGVEGASDGAQIGLEVLPL